MYLCVECLRPLDAKAGIALVHHLLKLRVRSFHETVPLAAEARERRGLLVDALVLRLLLLLQGLWLLLMLLAVWRRTTIFTRAPSTSTSTSPPPPAASPSPAAVLRHVPKLRSLRVHVVRSRVLFLLVNGDWRSVYIHRSIGVERF